MCDLINTIVPEVTDWNVNKLFEEEVTKSRSVSDCKETDQIMEEVTAW